MNDEAVESIAKSTRNTKPESVMRLHENTLAQFPSIPLISRTFQKHRKIVYGIPTLPSSRDGFEIPDNYKNLSNGGFFFLQFDSGS